MAGGFNPDDLASKLGAVLEGGDEKQEQTEEEKKAAFKKRMKNHYKGEFNMANLLRQKPPVDEDEDDD